MGEPYSTKNVLFVYRIFDPIKGKYCSSGHSLYGKGRSIWMNLGSAKLAWDNMPDEIKNRLLIKKFELVERL